MTLLTLRDNNHVRIRLRPHEGSRRLVIEYHTKTVNTGSPFPDHETWPTLGRVPETHVVAMAHVLSHYRLMPEPIYCSHDHHIADGVLSSIGAPYMLAKGDTNLAGPFWFFIDAVHAGIVQASSRRIEGLVIRSAAPEPLPDTPLPTLKTVLDIERIGMEDFTTWIDAYRRTEDPKLDAMQRMLARRGVASRRMGSTFHAPILAVPTFHEGIAEALLATRDTRYGTPDVPLDDIDDHDPVWLTFKTGT